ncbi:MAG: phytanoyl-CoA dioxygenase family protein, partial [Pseudomonadales bacterium]
PAIIETVSRILGDDILVWACEFIIKEAHTDKHISWHQDLTYWGMASDSQQLTAWLALSEASPESGCMRFLPGSHTAQVAHRDTFASDNILSRGQEVAVEVDERHDVCAALKPGQMSLHHGLMFHASGPNVTDDRRIGIAIRYITPTLKSTRHSTDFAMLVAGANRCAHLIDVCGANTAFGPREMALYREVADHQSTTFNANAKEPLSYDRAATNGA